MSMSIISTKLLIRKNVTIIKYNTLLFSLMKFYFAIERLSNLENQIYLSDCIFISSLEFLLIYLIERLTNLEI